VTIFQQGRFRLHSGADSLWKIECDALTQEDWETLALVVAAYAGPFGRVVGVPRGGLALAKALEAYTVPASPALVVDDVLTTGRSMLDLMQEISAKGASVKGWVVFARGPCPHGVQALFQMPAPRP
jgi:hypothetical protein